MASFPLSLLTFRAGLASGEVGEGALFAFIGIGGALLRGVRSCPSHSTGLPRVCSILNCTDIVPAGKRVAYYRSDREGFSGYVPIHFIYCARAIVQYAVHICVYIPHIGLFHLMAGERKMILSLGTCDFRVLS